MFTPRSFLWWRPGDIELDSCRRRYLGQLNVLPIATSGILDSHRYDVGSKRQFLNHSTTLRKRSWLHNGGCHRLKHLKTEVGIGISAGDRDLDSARSSWQSDDTQVKHSPGEQHEFKSNNLCTLALNTNSQVAWRQVRQRRQAVIVWIGFQPGDSGPRIRLKVSIAAIASCISKKYGSKQRHAGFVNRLRCNRSRFL